MATQQNVFRTGRSSLVAGLGGFFGRLGDLSRGWFSGQHAVTRQVMVAAILVVALLAFELFNYDTTEFALESLLGSVSFAGLRWATVLAIAFCGIDFAGLARLITPQRDKQGGPADRSFKPTWLLLGAWLLGGGMNAIMTWWAVSLALMNHSLGNEVLTREQLLRMVPVFVAVLVWVTRILIISSFVMTADQATIRVSRRRASQRRAARPAPARAPVRSAPSPAPSRPAAVPASQPVAAATRPGTTVAPAPTTRGPMIPPAPARPNGVPQRPTVPRPPRGSRPNTVPVALRAKSGGRRNLA